MLQYASSADVMHSSRNLGMISDVGRMRKIDEDSILALSMSFGTNSKTTEFRLLAVADGMGGHAKGEEASRIALQTIAKTVVSRLHDGVYFTKLLEDGIEEANHMIHNYANEHAEAAGMGTTAVCALLKNDKVYLANIGDSRAYVISRDDISRRTKDHSYVQMLVDEGKISEAESQTHKMKNVITKAIGTDRIAKPDTLTFMLNPDEMLLLCCDGVMAHLTDDDIYRIVSSSHDPSSACQKIVDVANERGGSDNISLIILGTENYNVSAGYDSPTVIIPNNPQNE